MTIGTTEPAGRFPPQEDGLQRLWTPHRMVYIGGENKPAKGAGRDGCPFCAAPARTDEDALIVRRGRVAYALLNLYPYNSGHILVCPYRHVSLLTELTHAELVEVEELSAQAMRAVDAAMHPDGFNLGMNQGAVAGAGIAAHLHQHIVPRWAGDSNFFPIVAQTKSMPALLGQTRAQVADAWPDDDTTDTGRDHA